MSDIFNETKLEDQVDHATTFIDERLALERFRGQVITEYCSYNIGLRVSAIDLIMISQNIINRKHIIRDSLQDIAFYNGVIARMAQLEAGKPASEEYGKFNTTRGRNFIDMFLERVKYAPRSR